MYKLLYAPENNFTSGLMKHFGQSNSMPSNFETIPFKTESELDLELTRDRMGSTTGLDGVNVAYHVFNYDAMAVYFVDTAEG